MVELSKIFEISSNYLQAEGSKRNLNPSFSGTIIVAENGEFYGICSTYEMKKRYKVYRRYLAGILTEDKKTRHYGIALYLMSNDIFRKTIMCIVPDTLISKTTQIDCGAAWYAFRSSVNVGKFIKKHNKEPGKITMSIKQIYTDAQQDEKRINREYISLNLRKNKRLLEQLSTCREALIDQS